MAAKIDAKIPNILINNALWQSKFNFRDAKVVQHQEC